MKELRIDRERAIKVAAVAGLVVLGLSVLPGLLKTPEPPELPPDVGFTASETNPGSLLPEPRDPPHARSDDGEGRNEQKRGEEAGERKGRAAKPRDERRRNRPRVPRKAGRAARTHGGSTRKPAGSGAPAAPAPVAPAPPAAVAPAPAPAPVPVAPAPAPPPATPVPNPPPGDGSQEFAPR